MARGEGRSLPLGKPPDRSVGDVRTWRTKRTCRLYIGQCPLSGAKRKTYARIELFRWTRIGHWVGPIVHPFLTRYPIGKCYALNIEKALPLGVQ